MAFGKVVIWCHFYFYKSLYGDHDCTLGLLLNPDNVNFVLICILFSFIKLNVC